MLLSCDLVHCFTVIRMCQNSHLLEDSKNHPLVGTALFNKEMKCRGVRL